MSGCRDDPAPRDCPTCAAVAAALAGVSAEAAPERPEFTFRTSSHSPRWTVTCKSCGWRVEGDDPGTFAQADAHECGAEAAPGDAPDETDADDAADAPSVADQYPISDSEFIEPPFGVDTPPPNPSPDGTTRYARRGFGIASGAPPVMSNMRAPEPEGDNPAITPPSNPYPFHEPLRVEHHSDEDKRQAWDEGYAAGVAAGQSLPSTGTGWDRGYAAGVAAERDQAWRWTIHVCPKGHKSLEPPLDGVCWKCWPGGQGPAEEHIAIRVAEVRR